jgi:hypothetical protein
VGKHEAARANGALAFEREREAGVPLLGREGGAAADLDRGVLGELLAARPTEVRRSHARLGEQAAHRLGDRIARAVRVEHEHALARPSENQRGAQAGGPTSDDHCVEDRLAHPLVQPARMRSAPADAGSHRRACGGME